jgi:hypothetical protein
MIEGGAGGALRGEMSFVAAPARKVAAAAGGATERSHGRPHTATQTLLTNDPERLTIMIWKSPEVVRARLVWRTTRNPL